MIKTKSPAAPVLQENDEFCLPRIKSGDSSSKFSNPFDQSIRQTNLGMFIDFNNLTTENNLYKPALI